MAELDIAAFLRARLDEREASKDKIHHEDCDSKECRCYSGYPCNCGEPERTAADVAAKRQIIELHVGGHECREIHTGTYSADWPAEAPYGASGAEWRHACSEYVEADSICETLRLLAQPHAGHPEFREEWK